MLAKCRAGLVDYQVAVSQNVENLNEGINNIAEKSSFFFIINEFFLTCDVAGKCEEH